MDNIKDKSGENNKDKCGYNSHDNGKDKYNVNTRISTNKYQGTNMYLCKDRINTMVHYTPVAL